MDLNTTSCRTVGPQGLARSVEAKHVPWEWKVASGLVTGTRTRTLTVLQSKAGGGS